MQHDCLLCPVFVAFCFIVCYNYPIFEIKATPVKIHNTRFADMLSGQVGTNNPASDKDIVSRFRSLLEELQQSTVSGSVPAVNSQNNMLTAQWLKVREASHSNVITK